MCQHHWLLLFIMISRGRRQTDICTKWQQVAVQLQTPCSDSWRTAHFPGQWNGSRREAMEVDYEQIAPYRKEVTFLKSDGKKTIYIYISKLIFEQNFLPTNLGQIISRILRALVLILVSYTAFYVEAHVVLNHQLLCNSFSAVSCFCQKVYVHCQHRTSYQKTKFKYTTDLTDLKVHWLFSSYFEYFLL